MRNFRTLLFAILLCLPAFSENSDITILQDLQTKAGNLVKDKNPRINARGLIYAAVTSYLISKVMNCPKSNEGRPIDATKPHCINSVDRADIQWMQENLAAVIPYAQQLTTIPSSAFHPSEPIKIRKGHLEQKGEAQFFYAWFTSYTLPKMLPVGTQPRSKLLQAMGVNMTGAAFGPYWTIQGNAEKLSANFTDNNYAAHDLLYSPHKLPDWDYQKTDGSLNCPAISQQGFGFLGFNIEDQCPITDNQTTISKVLGNLPANNTYFIDVANEPAYAGSAPDTTPQLWRDWLDDDNKNSKGNSSIEILNQKWGTNFSDFDSVPVPRYVVSGHVTDTQFSCDRIHEYNKKYVCRNLTMPQNHREGLATFYDWSRFNDRRFSNYLVDLENQMKAAFSGDALYHVKWLTGYPTISYSVATAVNPVPIASEMDILDSDGWVFYKRNDPDFALTWQRPLLTQTILHSLHPNKPLMNSENHFLSDPGPYNDDASSTSQTQPWSFFRAAIWLQVVHGLQASFFWTFDSKKGPKNMVNGSDLSDRAQSLDAITQAQYEFQRLRPEIKAIQDQEANIAVVLSHASLTRDAGAAFAANPNSEVANPTAANCDRILDKATNGYLPTHLSYFCNVTYALMQLGQPVDILVDGTTQDFKKYKVIFIPNALYLSGPLKDKLQAATLKHKVRLIVIGEPPHFDPYGGVYPTMSIAETLDIPNTERDTHSQLQQWLKENKLIPNTFTDATGAIPYGVISRTVNFHHIKLVFLANVTPRDISLTLKSPTAMDAISGQAVSRNLVLKSLDIKMLKIATPIE